MHFTFQSHHAILTFASLSQNLGCIVPVHMTTSSIPQTDRALAERLRRWGLAEIAPIFIEMARPLGFVGGQLLTLASPVLTTIVDEQRLTDWIDLLDDEARLDQLERLLEDEVEP